MTFADRTEAGRRLAARLTHLRGRDTVVLALPRGGVPVAAEVAEALGAPLDVLVVRKLGLPFQPEAAMGAIGEEGVRVVDADLIEHALVGDGELAAVEAHERAELERRVARYRGGRRPVPIRGRTVVVVDDGVATGSTAQAACRVARGRGAAHVVLAVPVAAPAALRALRGDADAVVCVEAPEPFRAVGEFYADFSAVGDEDVVALLGRAAPAPVRPAADPPVRDEDVTVEAAGVVLAGHLTVPGHALATVVFAYGASCSRHSPRNRYVAAALNEARLATLLFDLLAPGEDYDRANVFDIDLLAERLACVTRWLRAQDGVGRLPVGYFGASTGAAAALVAAAAPGSDIAAVVCRGGRPDLAERRLADVVAPTLLVVGGNDPVVRALNRQAQGRLAGHSRLAVVPGASHLFEEPGALAAVADLARVWFLAHLAPPQPVAPVQRGAASGTASAGTAASWTTRAALLPSTCRAGPGRRR